MDAKTKTLFRKQISRCRAAAQHMKDAADLLTSARVDNIPDDLRGQAVSIECLVLEIEEQMNPPSADIIHLRDHMPITG